MQFTSAQQATLKTWLLANASGLSDTDAAVLLNAAVTPDFWVWRSFVPEDEIYEKTTPDATTWDWTVFIAQPLQEQGAWERMVSRKGGIKPVLTNERAGIAKVFAGAGAGPVAQRAHLLAAGRRKATVGEKIFATGTGSTAVPATFATGADGAYMEGEITAGKVAETRG